MKLSKIFLLAGAVLAFSSCSENEEWNTSNEAVVSMASEAMTVSEAAGMFNIPFVVSGERNAPVQVTFEVTPVEESDKLAPAVADVNYLLTSNVINVAADSEKGNLEVIAVNDEKVNAKNSAFVVTIISVKGGTIDAEKASCVVTLKDPSPYEAMGGKWLFSSSAGSWQVTVHTATEDAPEYNNTLYITGIYGYDWTVATMSYQFNMETGVPEVAIIPGLFAEDVNFGLGGLNDVYLYTTVVEDGKTYLSAEPIVGVVSEDTKTIDFGESTFYGSITDKAGNNIGYRWFQFNSCKMTR